MAIEIKANITNNTVKATVTQTVIKATVKDRGPQGPQGERGPQGPQGEIGPQGIPGAAGPTTVETVNGRIGDVVLTQDDIGDGTGNKQYSAADKTKLAGIAVGAEVNVQADWNAVSGDAQILNKPTIPTAISQLTTDAAHRTVSDTEKLTWNGKQDALGFTPENVANRRSTFQATPDHTHYPTEKLVKDSLDLKQAAGSYLVAADIAGKEDISNKDTTVTLGTSDTKYPSQKAVKTYVDNIVVGVLNYRGAYDASGNVYPSSGGSGTAGAILKGDMYIVSVAGTLGGNSVQVGDSLIANVNTPGQTAGNWDILDGNVSYTPEDVANKVTSVSGASTDAQYPSAKLLYDSLALKLTANSPITGATKTKITYDANGLVTSGANATQDDIGDGTTNKQYSATEKTKLAGIATGANVGVVPNGAITGATKTKITYDTKGLVTAGADATTADIADSTNKRYVTDAQLTVIGNTSGTNTGDQTLPVKATGAEINIGTDDAKFATAKALADQIVLLKTAGGNMTGPLTFSGTGNAGLKLNSLTTTQRDDLTPANGMLLYNSTLAQVQKYENSQWVDISKSPATKVIAPSGSGYAADYYTDGTADDVEIQAAIDAINTAGGGKLFCRTGIYTLASTVTIPSNITICGEGIKTILFASASLSGTLSIITNDDFTTGNTNIVIENLSIDGNQTNRSGKILQDTAGHNVNLRNCTYSRISNVVSYNGVVSCLSLGRQSQNCIIENCVAYNSWDHNILLLGSSSSLTCSQNIIRNNVSYGAGQGAGQGVGIELATYATENTIIGNVSKDNLEGGIHCYNNSQRNIIANNVSESNGQNGIALVDLSDYNIITGNIIKDCTQAGINCTISLLAHGGQHLQIENNTIINCGWNGVRGTTSGDLGASIIIGNTITGCGSGGGGNNMTAIYTSNVVDLIITNNYITLSYERSIRLETANRTIISNNYISAGGQGGGSSNHAIFIDTGTSMGDNSIIGNIIESNPGAGVLIGHNAARMVIKDNIIKGMTSNAGLDLRGVSYSTISNNVCSGNATQGIVLKQDAGSVQSTYNTVSHNICTSNTTGGIVEQNTANYNIYIGNNCNGNTANNFVTVGANDEIGHNITT